jgi:mitochondrial import receptor subunit TOM70
MSESTPLSAPPTQLQAPSSLWDRVSTWVSENKVAAYTIAGTVVVVTGAGAIYYLSDSKKPAPTEKKKSKKERRKEKKEAEEAARKVTDVEASMSTCFSISPRC